MRKGANATAVHITRDPKGAVESALAQTFDLNRAMTDIPCLSTGSPRDRECPQEILENLSFFRCAVFPISLGRNP